MRKTISILLICLISVTAYSQKKKKKQKEKESDGWELLGTDYTKMDKDSATIIVIPHENAFTKLKIRMIRSPLNLLTLKVHYANGDVQDIEITQKNIPISGYSEVFDLAGNDKKIKKVTLSYNNKYMQPYAYAELFGKD